MLRLSLLECSGLQVVICKADEAVQAFKVQRCLHQLGNMRLCKAILQLVHYEGMQHLSELQYPRCTKDENGLQPRQENNTSAWYTRSL